jgi:ABC-2 type transport system ATP-binding protein
MIDTYSGGMKRRLDLAAALVHNPDVLFLDEPTTGLDPVSRVRVWDEVRRLNRELGMTIFLTTQYLEEADSLADRVGIIDGGRLVAEGTPADLKRRVGQDVVVARISSDASIAARAVRELLEVQSAEIRGDELVINMASGCKGAATIGPIAIALDNAAVEVSDLTLRTPTLDDVFLELTGTRISSAESDARDAASSDDRSLIDLDTLETVQ